MADTIGKQIADLKYIIGAPLVATVDADSYAAQAFVNFIQQYGFESATHFTKEELRAAGVDYPTVAGENQFGKLRMITFWYSYDSSENVKTKDGGVEKKTVKRHVSVTLPVLSLIPMPILKITDAEYNFDIRITGVYDPSPPPSRGFIPLASAGDQAEVPKLMATYTPLAAESKAAALTPSLIANMKIKINVKQGDIPAGISSILNIISESTTKKTN